MESLNFRELEIGDEFRLDGRLYRKRTNYSALLLDATSGDLPATNINRMIRPGTAVVDATEHAGSV